MAFGDLKGTWTFTANSILATNAATSATGTTSVVVGDLIVVVCGEQTGLTCTDVTDTLGNSYSAVNAGTNAAATISGRCFYSRVTVAGANTNITVAATGSANNVAIVAASFSGPFVVSPLDTQPANNNNTDNTTPFTCPATGTLAQAIELVIGWMTGTSGATWTASAPNTKANQAVSQSVADTILGYQVANVTTTVSPAFAGTNPTASVQGTASFKADTSRTTYFKNEWMGDTPAFTAREYPLDLRTFARRNVTLLNSAAPLQYMPGRVLDWGILADTRQARTWVDFNQDIRAVAITPPTEFAPSIVTEWSIADPAPFWTAYPAPFNAALRAITTGPLNQDDWSVPTARYYDVSLRTWTKAAQRVPPVITFAQDDWPVPAAPDYSISLRTFIAINPPLLATSPPPPILMPPLIVEWGVSDRTTFEPARIQYNAPLLTAAPIQPPFSQDDWPVPSTHRQPDRTFQRAFPRTLVGQDRLPIRQQDWRVPIAPDYSISLRSFLASPGLPLITAPVQPPFSQDDWPLPIAAIQPIRTWTQSPTIATPVVAPTFMPGRVSEWGMWERVPFSAAPIANLTLSFPTEVVAVEYIFREPYYSPQWPGRRFETWTTSVNLALRAGPPPQKPFNQTDWPLTPAARQPDRTYQRAFPPELIGQDRLPVRQQNWPLTAAPYYDSSLRTQTQRAATPVQAPFSQDDWPVPTAPRQPDRTFQRFFPPTLVGQDQFPVRQQVWPVPIATEFSNALRSIGFRSPALDVTTQRPFVQSNWPLTPAASQPDRTFQRSFPRVLIGKDRLPIRQQDWPLPIAPRPAADLRTYIAQSPIRLIGKDRLPFRQMHWPVPLAPLEFHTLRSITQGRVIYGGEVAPIPPEPPLPPPPVIAHVRAHADAYYGVSYFDEIKGRADFSRAKGSNDEEAAN